MTPTLRRLIDSVTCHSCLGNGAFACAEVTRSEAAKGIVRHERRTCPNCLGTGIQPLGGHPDD